MKHLTKVLSLSVLTLVSGKLYASDTEIYQAATPSQTTLMFMLDASASMTERDGGGKRNTRIARLKKAMQIVLDSGAIPDTHHIGLSVFQGDYGDGKIRVRPTKTFKESKSNLKSEVDQISAAGATPTASAYAQAANEIIQFTKNRTDQQKRCDVQGIYVLTDGFPNDGSNGRQYNGYFSNNIFYTPVTAYNTTDRNWWWRDSDNSWRYIASLSNLLTQVNIKTAVVGFGNEFKNTRTSTDANIINTIKWGKNSGFNFYEASETEDIVNSIKQTLNDLNNSVPPVTMGTTVIPNNPYISLKLSDKGYLNELVPTLGENTPALWLGNLEKFNVLNNKLVGDDNRLALNNSGTLNEDTIGLWNGGVKTKLPETRTIFTDRATNATSTNTLVAIDNNYLSRTTNDKSELQALRISKEMGAVMHSSPVIVGQKATVKVKNDELQTVENSEENYILFGTTQGLLHLVKEDTGEEKFTFLPNEIIKKQKKAFLGKDNTTVNSIGINLPKDIYYGVDGAWTLYTNYTKTNENNQIKYDLTGNDAVQYAYGGLRMGGRSYYALDLKNINSPKLAFTISPDDKKVYSQTLGNKEYQELENMGQSWSKPTIGFVNWKDSTGKVVPRRVMFLGGGYDAGGTHGDGELIDGMRTYKGYEQDTYHQINGIGGGVYMFDAQTGELLWWAGSNTKHTSLTSGVKFQQVNDMKYSITNAIKTVDRNGDGLIDHLYFGDLGGQVWRVDINNEATNDNSFIKQPEKIFNRPNVRFYEEPAVSTYQNAKGKFAVISIGSGNRSRPLLNQETLDAIYNIFDRDIFRNNLFTADFANVTKNVAIDQGENNIIEFNPEDTSRISQYSEKIKKSGGWYYNFQRSNGSNPKVTSTPIVIKGHLYVTTFDPTTVLSNDNQDCGAKIKGSSNVTQFYLPYGNKTGATNYTIKTVNLGTGLVAPSISSVSDGSGRIVMNTVATQNHQEFQSFKTPQKLAILKWYEGN